MRVNINKCNLFFDVYGAKLKITSQNIQEKPTLIVLHGGHGFIDHTLYVEFWSQFSDRVQVIFLDQRGCGRSDLGKPEEWNLQQWSDDLYVFCEVLDIKNPIVAGISIGGHVMCEFVCKHNDYPAGLIFCNTEAHYLLESVCNKLQELGGVESANACREFYSNPTAITFENYIKYCVPYYGKKSYSSAELSRCVKHPEIFLDYCKSEILNFNYLNDMKKIQCPTLLMAGRDSLHVIEAAEQMANRIPPEYLTFEILEDAGAPVYKDCPDESYEIVRKFLEHF